MSHKIRSYLIAGLLVWLPIWATLLVLHFLIGIMDSTMSMLPVKYQPQALLGFNIPGLALIVAVLVIFLTGMLVANYLGRKLILFGEAILERIPLVRTIYKAVKQVAETLFSSSSESFRHVILVEYPRKGLWSIAFQTGKVCEEVQDATGDEMLTIFIPTTPNPTSGFLMMVPKRDCKILDMSIDEAVKLIISLGVVQPKN